MIGRGIEVVIVTFSVGAEVAGVAAGVFADGDRVARAIGDLGDARLALVKQSIRAGELVAIRRGGIGVAIGAMRPNGSMSV